MSPQRRAKVITHWLMESNSEKLGSRQCDNYLENFDGEKVVREIVRQLKAKGISHFEELPANSQRYACRNWWDDKYYNIPEDNAFGIPLF